MSLGCGIRGVSCFVFAVLVFGVSGRKFCVSFRRLRDPGTGFLSRVSGFGGLGFRILGLE